MNLFLSVPGNEIIKVLNNWFQIGLQKKYK